MKQYVMLGMIVVILVLVVVQSFQINAIKGNSIAKTSDGKTDMSGWTDDEKMMYEHHGTLPVRLQGGNTQASSSGMVGGC